MIKIVAFLFPKKKKYKINKKKFNGVNPQWGKFVVLTKDSSELSVHSLKQLNEEGNNLIDSIEKINNDCKGGG